MVCTYSVAQFGGREGDVVIFAVSAKGNRDFRVVPPPTTNDQTGLLIEDPKNLPDEPFGPDFPGESRRLMAPPDYVSPVVPPGSNGIEFLLQRGNFLGIIPWVSLRELYPGAGWSPGIDVKLLEDDEELGVTLRVLRLRPGRETPWFRVDASTHLWVLSGRVMITPAGGTKHEMRQDIYAFVPRSLAIQ
ncbi:MAG: hypothetical protein P8Y94_05825, partial [Acidobacteriota bacterium]